MIRFINVSKSYGNRVILDNINFEISDGEFVFLMGSSGGGKTTIFKLLELIERPDKGEIWLDNTDIVRLSDSNIPQLRRQVGIVFQDYKLITSKTVFENVALSLELLGYQKKNIQEIVASALEVVNLKGFEKMFPSQLSGGEKQRVAIARAIVTNPSILLADEPTGNLDSTSAKEIILILKKINERGTTVLMATHDEGIVKSLPKRVIKIEAGKINFTHEKITNKIVDSDLNVIGNKDSAKSVDDKAQILKSEKIKKDKITDIPPEIKPPVLGIESEEVVKSSGFFSHLKSSLSRTKFAKDSNHLEQNIEVKLLSGVVEVPKEEIQANSHEKVIDEKHNSTNIQRLKLSNELLLALERRGIDNIGELVKMSDATLSRIVGVINVWKVRQAIKTLKNQK